jgi:hypothetical protein
MNYKTRRKIRDANWFAIAFWTVAAIELVLFLTIDPGFK